jgi:leucyl/phenylalanyl-tRNA--protein transferase
MDSLRQDFASLFSEGVAPDPDTTPWGVRRRRDMVFRESLPNCLARSLHNASELLKPPSFGRLNRLLAAPQREPALPSFAQIAAGLGDLCGPVSANLSACALFDLYARGLYLEPVAGMLAWQAPPFRRTVDLNRKIASKSQREIGWTVTLDRDFEQIVASCARPARGIEHAGGAPTWFAPKVLYAFSELFDAGLAHSFEVVDASGSLVGGGYGVALGRIFVTESWFSLRRGGGEAGLAELNRRLARWGYVLNDVKTRFCDGFEPMSRSAYMQILANNLSGGKHGRWRHG